MAEYLQSFSLNAINDRDLQGVTDKLPNQIRIQVIQMQPDMATTVHPIPNRRTGGNVSEDVITRHHQVIKSIQTFDGGREPFAIQRTDRFDKSASESGRP
jgi:hypothetical protein